MLGHSIGLTRHTPSLHVISAPVSNKKKKKKPQPNKTNKQPAIKFPTVLLYHLAGSNFWESKRLSITPPSGVHMKMISSLSLQLYPDHKHSKSIFSHLLMHSCRENQPKASSVQEGVLYQTTPRGQERSPRCSTEQRQKVQLIPYLPAPP